MVQALYYIKVSLVNLMAIESMQDWLNLNAIKSFLTVHKCKVQWDIVFMYFFLELVDNMEMFNCWEACSEVSLFSRLVEV